MTMMIDVPTLFILTRRQTRRKDYTAWTQPKNVDEGAKAPSPGWWSLSILPACAEPLHEPLIFASAPLLEWGNGL